MKKLLLVLVLIAIITTGTAFASSFAIGVHGGFGGIGGGAGVNFVVSNLFFYVDALGFGENHMVVSGACDFVHLLNNEFVKTLSFYIRVGVGASFWGSGDNLGLAASVRLPIGLSWRPISLIEVFLQVVPQLGLRVLPDVALWGNYWGGNIGIRLWF